MMGQSTRTADLVIGVIGLGVLAVVAFVAGFFSFLGGAMAVGSCTSHCPGVEADVLVYGGAAWTGVAGIATAIWFVVRANRRQSVWWLPLLGGAVGVAGTYLALSTVDRLLS